MSESNAGAKPAEIAGKGEIIRKDGTKVPFEFVGKTTLSEQELRKKIEDK